MKNPQPNKNTNYMIAHTAFMILMIASLWAILLLDIFNYYGI